MLESASVVRPLENKDIQRILELATAGKSDHEIAKDCAVPYWAVLLIKSLYG
jgi:hypothetical protein